MLRRTRVCSGVDVRLVRRCFVRVLVLRVVADGWRRRSTCLPDMVVKTKSEKYEEVPEQTELSTSISRLSLTTFQTSAKLEVRSQYSILQYG